MRGGEHRSCQTVLFRVARVRDVACGRRNFCTFMANSNLSILIKDFFKDLIITVCVFVAQVRPKKYAAGYICLIFWGGGGWLSTIKKSILEVIYIK